MIPPVDSGGMQMVAHFCWLALTLTAGLCGWATVQGFANPPTSGKITAVIEDRDHLNSAAGHRYLESRASHWRGAILAR